MRKAVLFLDDFMPLTCLHLKAVSFLVKDNSETEVFFGVLRQGDYQLPTEMLKALAKNDLRYKIFETKGNTDILTILEDFKRQHDFSHVTLLIHHDLLSEFDDDIVFSENETLAVIFDDPSMAQRPQPGVIPVYVGNLPQTKEKALEGTLIDCPRPILEYIVQQKLFFASNLSYFLTELRYQHSLRVALTAYDIALSNGLDPLKAFTAGIFHDCAKDLVKAKQKDILDQHFPNIYPVEPFAYHQFASSYLASAVFKIKDKEILQAIESHCTGTGNMSKLDKCIYTADKVEPGREFETYSMRQEAIKDLDASFKAVLKDQVRYFHENNIRFLTCKYTHDLYKTYIPLEVENDE
ncbi:MAG: bis(5'-nucleosyl)-tetraphosphatase (symmetrical) YqeK [Bacilli bacterium]